MNIKHIHNLKINILTKYYNYTNIITVMLTVLSLIKWKDKHWLYICNIDLKFKNT